MTEREALKLALDFISRLKFADAEPEPEQVMEAIKEALAHPERHELQANGKHPAPCARFCEANAFQIEIRNLKARLAQPEQEWVGLTEQEAADCWSTSAVQTWREIEAALKQKNGYA